MLQIGQVTRLSLEILRFFLVGPDGELFGSGLSGAFRLRFGRDFGLVFNCCFWVFCMKPDHGFDDILLDVVVHEMKMIT